MKRNIKSEREGNCRQDAVCSHSKHKAE